MPSFGDAEKMSLTLFLNTFASPTKGKLGISRKYSDTALL
jgi:hypothetical protein